MNDSPLENRAPADSGVNAEAHAPVLVTWADASFWGTLWFLLLPAALAICIAVLDVRLPPFLLYLFAGIIGLVLFIRSLKDPEWLFAVFIIYIPLNKLYVVPILPGINGTNALLLLLIISWFVRASREERPLFSTMPNSGLVGFWAVLTMLSAVTVMVTINVGFFLGQATEFKAWVDQFIVFFAFLNLIRNGAQARRVVVYTMIGAVVVMILGFQEMLGKLGMDSIEKSRVMGPQNQPNDFGAFLVYSAAPFLAIFLMYIGNWRSWLMLPYFGILAKLLLTTFSRGAYMGMALAGVVAGYFRGKAFLVFWTALGIGALVAMPELIPESLVDRMAQTTVEGGQKQELDASSQHRIILWNAAIDMSLESPIFGKGFKAFPAFKSRYTEYEVRESDNHNMYLWISSQMGIPALLIFLWILWRTFRLGIRLCREHSDKFARAIGLGGASMVAGLALINMFGSRVVSLDVTAYFWITLAVMAHLWVEHEQQQKNKDLPASA
jgi:O-antigen ligase